MQIAVVKLPNLREYLILFNPSLLLSYKVQISLMPNAVLNTLFLENFPGGCAPLAPAKGLRPWTPLGAAPPDPCHSLLAPLAAQLLWTRQLASLAKSPPQRKNLATCLTTQYICIKWPLMRLYETFYRVILRQTRYSLSRKRLLGLIYSSIKAKKTMETREELGSIKQV